MKDCEIELKLKYRNRKKVIAKLKEMGAKFKENYELHDTYLSFHKKMSNEHELVRIREKGQKKELTFKGKCEDKNHVWKRTEITAKIVDSDKISEILLNLGLNKIKENQSIREIFMLGDLEITFIDFIKPSKISLIELEGTEEEIEQAVTKLGDLVERAGEEAFKIFD